MHSRPKALILRFFIFENVIFIMEKYWEADIFKNFNEFSFYS
jgi:hypothetical protein